MLAPERCALCDREGEKAAKGWRAFQTQEDDDSDAPGAIGVGVFCPQCAEWEFGRGRR
jgi:hypothetical protein